MIRLIASDLDGTIINAKNQCDPSVTEEIRRLREHGMKFAVCSGRPIDSVLPLLEGWGLRDLSDYVVGSNGGEVLETATGKRQEYYPLEPDLIREIIDLYEPLNLIPTLYDGTRLYVSRIYLGGLSVSSPSGERKDACGLRKWCKLLVLKFYWSPA